MLILKSPLLVLNLFSVSKGVRGMFIKL